MEIIKNIPLDWGVYLFGSYSRGDQTSLSDKDILCVLPDAQANEVLTNISQNKIEEVSYYSFQKLKDYYNSGSLFAWHLFYESKHMQGPDYLASLGKPCEYMEFEKDYIELISILHSVMSTLEDFEPSTDLTYEAGLLYVVLRNFGHCISWYEASKPIFNKYVPYELSHSDLLNLDIKEYETLILARSSSMRGNEAPVIKREWLLKVARNIEIWMKYKRQSFE